MQEGNLCQVHGKVIDLVCIDTQERICSNCALFLPQYKGCDIRLETDVLEEINLRTECLMEMF